MKKITLVVLAFVFLQGCSSVQVSQDSPHGVVVFSTSLVSGCDDSTYFNNGILYVENSPEPGSITKMPIGHVAAGKGFIVKNIFKGVDFGKTGRVHINEFLPGTYYLTKMYATPRSFVYHETEVLGVTFTVEPGKIHYLGSIGLGTTECVDNSVSANIGSRTVVDLDDAFKRDMEIAKAKWTSMPSSLVKKSLMTLSP